MRWAAVLLAALCVAALAADEPAPRSFAVHATLDTAARSGLLRVPVPPQALAHLQSPDAADLRIFDDQGHPVPFALSAPALPAPAPREQTAAFPGLPLYTAEAGAPSPAGAMQLRIERNGQQQSVWVDLGQATTPPPATRRLDAALFDTRGLKDPLSALVVRARVPPNTPIRFTVETSADLAQWTAVPVQGRIFRFEGADAPANEQLAFSAPVQLHERYLRLDWSGQAGVSVDAVVGLLPRVQPEPALPATTLAAPFTDGPAALEWSLGFATPMRKLALGTTQPNTLVPVRVLGRNEPSQPWRPLAQAVIWRVGAGADESRNPPLELGGVSVRWLRVEATHGARLQGLPLAAEVFFDPLEAVFVAGAAVPYQLAAGRERTPPAALPVSVLGATTSMRVQDLPSATVTRIDAQGDATGWWSRWLPRGVDGKTAALWLVLGLGVALLAGVAWSLLRQLHASAAAQR